MINKILSESYHKILEDTPLIRLAVVTTIFHSLIFVLYIMYQTYYIITQLQGQSLNIEKLQQVIEMLFGTYQEFAILILIIAIILGGGYFLLPPIAKASLIYYLEDNKGTGLALGKGVKKFFTMFEFHALISVFNFLVYILALSRFYVMGIIDHPLIIFIMTIWLVISIATSLFLPYVNYLITLKDYAVNEAIKKSISLSLENFGTTIKFVLINYLLYMRFIFNILIVIGVPLLLMYLIVYFNIYQLEFIKYGIYIILAILILITAYINAIIEAFFLTYWYKVYKRISTSEDENE